MGFAVGQAQASAFDDVAPVAFDPPPVPFWSAVSAGFNDQTQTRNLGAREEALRADLWERHAKIQKALGRELPLSMSMVATDPDPNAQRAQIMAGAVPDGLYEQRLDEERRKNPNAFAGIQTRDQLMASIDARLNAVRARAAAAGGPQGNSFGTFVGAMGGSLTDPANVTAMLVVPGGAGRSLAARVLTAGLVNAGVETAQAPFRAIEAAKVGGPVYGAREAGADVASAFAGGVVFGGAAEGLGALARHAPGLRHLFADDAELRGAAHVVDTGARDDLAIGPVDGLTHEEGLDALVRGAPPPPVEPARELGDLFGDTPTPGSQKTAIGSYKGFSGPITGEADYMGRKILQGSFDPRDLAVDPQRFQYKAEGDAAGVTARLRGIEAWDPTASGKVIVFEQRDGRRFVADGHQRLALAQRLDAKGFDPKLDGFLFREADGWSARQVRTIAALKNIREGSGTILDAAKIFRDAPDAMRDPSLPVTGDFITQARALARLDPEAFGAVVNKVVSERYAAEIGAMAPDRPDLHVGLVKLLREGQPASLEEARALINEAKLDDWIAREGEQTDMFGGLPPESTTIARAKVKAAVLAGIKKDARVYGQLVKHADAIEAGGNVLLRDANEIAAVVNRTALEVLSRLSLRSGEVGEAMARAAAEVLDGKRPADAARGITTMVRNRIAAGEQLEGLRLTQLDPPAPTQAAADLVAKADDPKTWEAQAAEAPEDMFLPRAGMFDDLGELGAEERAHARLKRCIPGE